MPLRLLDLTVWVALAACAPASTRGQGEGGDARAAPPGSAGVVFPQLADGGPMMEALLTGPLRLDGACLYVGDLVVVWQPHHALVDSAGVLGVRDGRTGVEARVGDVVSLGGGAGGAPGRIGLGLRTPLPTSCGGAVWVAGVLGGIERVVVPAEWAPFTVDLPPDVRRDVEVRPAQRVSFSAPPGLRRVASDAVAALRSDDLSVTVTYESDREGRPYVASGEARRGVWAGRRYARVAEEPAGPGLPRTVYALFADGPVSVAGYAVPVWPRTLGLHATCRTAAACAAFDVVVRSVRVGPAPPD